MSEQRSSEQESRWQEVRALVLKRDDFSCTECGRTPDPSELDVHHILPRSLGGTDEVSNCRTLCDSCHAMRHPHFQVGLAGRFLRRWTLRLAQVVDRTRHLPAATKALDYGLALFGLKRFREGQLDAVLAAMRGESVLVVRPTGSGKSLCFQLPAVLSEGSVSIVISPLKALMEDQFRALQRNRIPATFINSDVGADERERRFELLNEGAFRLLYVAPERFDVKSARSSDVEALSKLKPPYLIIDEAHLVDQWGLDFRPSYSRLDAVRNALGDPPVLAFTATAGKQRQERIKESLGIQEARTLVSGTDRPNITLLRLSRPESVRTGDHWAAARARIVADLAANLSSGRGLVFVPTVKIGKDLQANLSEKGVKLDLYHGKLDAEERGRITEDFLSDDGAHSPLLITTSAFSLGIDIPDIRLVVHMQHPASVEEYLQEFGRAGRDGLPSTAVLFTDPEKDLGLLEWMAEKTIEEALDEGRLTLEEAKAVREVRDHERGEIARLSSLGVPTKGEPRPSWRSEKRKGGDSGTCFRRALGKALGAQEDEDRHPASLRLVRWLLGSKEKVESGVGCCDLCDPALALMVAEGRYDASSPDGQPTFEREPGR